MEPILLYGFPLGSSAGLVAAFEWLGQPYRLCRVDMLSDIKTEAYVRLNGRGETPVLITDDGRVLTETTAIAGWLEARDQDHRISFAPGSAETDRMRQWIGFVNSSFTGAFSPLWAALEMNPPDPVVQTSLRVFGRKAAAKRQAQLEAMIGDTRFLVADRPSLADGLLAGVARWADFHEVWDPRATPRLAELRGRIESDPAFVFAQAVEAGDTPAGSGAMAGQVPLEDILARWAPAAG